MPKQRATAAPGIAASAPSVRRAGRPRSEEAAGRILDATMDVVGELGLSGATVNAIAAKARAGLQTIYRRWPSKEQLIREAVARATDRYIVVSDTGNLRADLILMVKTSIEMMGTRVGATIKALVAEAMRDPAWAREVTAFGAYRRRQSRRVVMRAIARKELPESTDPDLLIDLLAGPIWHRILFGARIDSSLVDRLVDKVLFAHGWVEPKA